MVIIGIRTVFGTFIQAKHYVPTVRVHPNTDSIVIRYIPKTLKAAYPL